MSAAKEKVSEKSWKGFEDAAELARKMQGVATSDKKYLYAHYKQATVGDAPKTGPSIIMVTERAKYNAWDEIRGMEPEKALDLYVKKVQELEKSESVTIQA